MVNKKELLSTTGCQKKINQLFLNICSIFLQCFLRKDFFFLVDSVVEIVVSYF